MPGPSTVNPTTFAWSYGTVTPISGQTGVAGNVIADVSGAFVQATLNNNFRVLADKVNAIIALLQSNGTLV